MCKKIVVFLVCLISHFRNVIGTYNVHLSHDGPIVKGATITFNATVYYGDNIVVNDNLRYDWEDNGIPPHKNTVESSTGINVWPVTYNSSIYPQGRYEVQITVIRCYTFKIFCYPIGSIRQYFYITELLNGNLKLVQNNITRSNHYVSSKDTVTHTVELKKTDANYIRTAPTVLSYWFVDCVYYGVNQDLSFNFNYNESDKTHTVETLILADFTPLPPTTTVPPSTTTKATTTTSKPTTTSTTTTTTTTTTKTSTTKTPAVTTLTSLKPSVTTSKSLMSNKNLVKREVDTGANVKNKSSTIMMKVNGTLVPYDGPLKFPYVCNNTQVTIDPSMTYGYFSEVIDVKAPLSKPNVTGNNWLQPGDLLSLKVSCSGSREMEYCVEYKKGEYNVTGNETCFVYSPLDTCDFSITRYFSYPKNTIIIIIKNDVSKVVTPVAVNIYKVNKQAQLSVIVVPVAFSLVAVVMIVFGVAYYIQNRTRFIVEVADFNFGQQYTNVEYKTFRERLRDSVMNAFTRGPTPSSSEVPVWPPGQKYGSMT